MPDTDIELVQSTRMSLENPFSKVIETIIYERIYEGI
jgi:hypothetical protein